MKRVLKWVAIGVGGIVGLAVLALAVVYGVSEYRMRSTYQVPAIALSLHDDAATLARGEHLVTIRGCIDCHRENFAGGKFLDVPLIGTVYASNLTRGSNGAASFFTEQDWDRAIRHGVRPNGSPLLIMPAQEYQGLSDEDVAAMVAYLKSLPPVDTKPETNSVGPLGRFLEVSGKEALIPARRIDHVALRKPAPASAPTQEYGAYLATSCTGCHGENLSGGPVPGMPPGTPVALNLTPDASTGLGSWSEADFVRALREGKRPDGSAIRPPMPWKLTAQLTDDEIHALWLHLRSLPPRPFKG